MKEIEVGEYVRDCEGNIEKIINIINKDLYIGNYGNSYPKNCIVKHSPNIIDLIEVEDYVNGSKVVGKDNNCILILTDGGQTCYRNIFENKDIKSILTKESFKNAEYRVEAN